MKSGGGVILPGDDVSTSSEYSTAGCEQETLTPRQNLPTLGKIPENGDTVATQRFRSKHSFPFQKLL
jgi:hypothetical protein